MDTSLCSKNDAIELSKLRVKIDGFTRFKGSKLTRFRHKAEFGICISKKYWGHGIGKELLENVLLWADTVGIEKISLTVVATNIKAIHML